MQGQVSVGHPVDVATGKLYHDFEDFVQPGRMPIVFGRRYSSGLTGRTLGLFGEGWSSPFEMRVRETVDGYKVDSLVKSAALVEKSAARGSTNADG